MREKDNYKNWDWSQMGKYKNTKLKPNLKPKAKKGGGCGIVYWGRPAGPGFIQYMYYKSSITAPRVQIYDHNNSQISSWIGPIGGSVLTSSAGVGEIAKHGNKIWYGATYRCDLGPGSTGNVFPNDCYGVIVELDFDPITLTCSLNKIMPAEIPFVSNEMMACGFADLGYSNDPVWKNDAVYPHTAINSTTLLGIFRSCIVTRNQPPLEHTGQSIIQWDVSGSTAIGTILHDIPILPPDGYGYLNPLGGGPWGANLNIDSYTYAFADIMYIPSSHSIIGSNHRGVVTHMDLATGNIIDQIGVDQFGNWDGNNIGGQQQSGTQSIACFCNDGSLYFHVHASLAMDGYFYELTLGPPMTLAIVATLPPPGGWFMGDAATDNSCCPVPEEFFGCMDPTALNYDPSVSRDCSWVTNGPDMSCCEYPCHKDIGSGPPPPPPS